MLTPYNFKGVTPYACSGNYFHYDTATAVSGDFGVEVFLNEASVGVFYPGDAYTAPQTFSRIRFQPTTDAIGVIRVGAGRIDSVKVSGTVGISGTPNVAVPGGVVVNSMPTSLNLKDVAAAAGLTYGITAGTTVSGAGSASYYLLVPTTATRRIRIDRIWAWTNLTAANDSVVLKMFTHTESSYGGSVGISLSGASSHTSFLHWGTATPTGLAHTLWFNQIDADKKTADWIYNGAILLPAGYGIEVNLAAAGPARAMTDLQWWEE